MRGMARVLNELLIVALAITVAVLSDGSVRNFLRLIFWVVVAVFIIGLARGFARSGKR